MKHLLAVILLILSTASFADTSYKEMYVSLEPTVQLVITNGKCLKFTASDSTQLNYAYAINIENGEKVDGCFTHSGDVIQIELTDDQNNFYSYKIHADKFVMRPNL